MWLVVGSCVCVMFLVIIFVLYRIGVLVVSVVWLVVLVLVEKCRLYMMLIILYVWIMCIVSFLRLGGICDRLVLVWIVVNDWW